MAKCQDCQQEMGDSKTESCLYDVISIDDVFYHRSTSHFEEPGGRCTDCEIVHGKFHHWGCDVERCPKCGRQLISCGCVNGDNTRLFMASEQEQQALTEPIRQPV